MDEQVFDDVVSIGGLRVMRERPGGTEELVVPLYPMDGSRRTGIDLWEGGVLWEDEAAHVSFGLETTAGVRRATLSVNDHNELWMRSEWLAPLYLGGVTSYRYEFVVDPANHSVGYTHPFALTCGFARVHVRVIFVDGRVAHYATPDIACLDEPRPGGDGQHGERAEESNVRSMYQALLAADDNQAGEWMFAPPAQGATSDDDQTDWAHQALARLLEVASTTLDLVYDSLEDETDGFPSTTEEPGIRSRFDTAENQAVRALLASLAQVTAQVLIGLKDAVDRLEDLLDRMRRLVARQGARRGTSQSLPALAVLELQLGQERSWLFEAADLAERAQDALDYFDEFVGGAGMVAELPFALPPREGRYLCDERYQQLFEAMSTWDRARGAGVERRDIALHAIKPDRLFEYYALHKLLFGLWLLGFREDEACGGEGPAARHAYRLAQSYEKYHNEWRSANTFRLRRVLADGGEQRVSLYYQPVIYSTGEVENGIDLVRTDVPEGYEEAVWTPDYLLVVHDAQGTRRYAMDAKYCAWSKIEGKAGKLAECVDKYLARSCVTGVGPLERSVVDGVWVLSGRLGGQALTSVDVVAEGLVGTEVLAAGERVSCGIVAWNRNTGQRKMRAFFRQLGLA